MPPKRIRVIIEFVHSKSYSDKRSDENIMAAVDHAIQAYVHYQTLCDLAKEGNWVATWLWSHIHPKIGMLQSPDQQVKVQITTGRFGFHTVGMFETNEIEHREELEKVLEQISPPMAWNTSLEAPLFMLEITRMNHEDPKVY